MEVSKKEGSNNLHIGMFPWFAYGHINPFIQLSNKLSSHGIQISFFSIPGNINRIKSSLNLTPPNQLIPLTIPPIEGLSPNFDSSSEVTHETSQLLSLALDQMQPQVKSHLLQLQPQIKVILFDYAYHWLPSLASELGIKSVHFNTFPLVVNSYLTVPSRMTDPNKIPTVEEFKKPPHGYPKTSTAASVKTFEAEAYNFLFKCFNGCHYEKLLGFTNRCDAILYRTCNEVEVTSDELDTKWRIWLSKFPEKSVIYCSFGSETSLNNAQIQELTLGLELTGLPFILVLNFGTSNTIDAQNKLEASLPDGFRERIKNRGVLHTGWVQQQNILAHTSVGCFLTHAGFSSVIEGIVNDCHSVN
ncbi:hypothetical protein SOVF_002570 [Spinacia oleracea]|nr:hypothetical protein SOVF_002570 [Spinacia oleracea]